MYLFVSLFEKIISNVDYLLQKRYACKFYTCKEFSNVYDHVFSILEENIRSNVADNILISIEVRECICDDFNTKKITIEQLSDAYKITKTI